MTVSDRHRVPEKVTELGVERFCSWCREWWPKDEEFWYMPHGKVLGRCIACWVTFNRTRRSKAA